MSIADIWKRLNTEQRGRLMALTIQDGISASTARNYLTGYRRPMKLYRESITGHVNSLLGEIHFCEDLFPEKVS